MKIQGSQVVVTVVLAAFPVAAWAVSRETPQPAPTGSSALSSPDYTQAGAERARHEMEKAQRLEEALRQRDEP